MREGLAGCGIQAIPITLKFRRAITIKKTALTRFRQLVALDPGDLLAPIRRRASVVAAGVTVGRVVAQRLAAGGRVAGVDRSDGQLD